MNWINSVVRPKIQNLWSNKREVPENLWIKCPESGEMVFHRDLEANDFVIPNSGFHMRMSAERRLTKLFDYGSFEKLKLPTAPVDPLKFRDERRYTDRLKDARAKTGYEDAIMIGKGRLEENIVIVAVQDFNFMGGSLGMAAGEAIITGFQAATAAGVPLQQHREAGLPYLVVLTNPTTGGVTASYAMLGDVHIAEPGALIGFAGQRVIEQTIREKLPEGFQRSEYLLEHGMVDMVVHRHKMRETLANLCRLLMKQPAAAMTTNLLESDAAKPSKAEQEKADDELEVIELEPVDSELKPADNSAQMSGKATSTVS